MARRRRKNGNRAAGFQFVLFLIFGVQMELVMILYALYDKLKSKRSEPRDRA